MEVVRIQYPEEIKNKELFLALGTFDGVHRGHQRVINTTKELAREAGVCSGVFTFEPHPLSVLQPLRVPGRLTPPKVKEQRIAALGVDFLFVQEFHTRFASLSKEDFIDRYLLQEMKVLGVVIGPKFFFGRRGEGNSTTLKEAGKEHSFHVEVVEPLKVGKRNISSTIIREMVQKGQVEEIPLYLGHPFTIWGTVSSGDGRGRKLGYPTANIHCSREYVQPRQGVYAVRVGWKNSWYIGVANLGTQPTFGGSQTRLEVHIIDLEANLYSQEVQVEFIQRIRDEMVFHDSASLQKKIGEDIEESRQIVSRLLATEVE